MIRNVVNVYRERTGQERDVRVILRDTVQSFKRMRRLKGQRGRKSFPRYAGRNNGLRGDRKTRKTTFVYMHGTP